MDVEMLFSRRPFEGISGDIGAAAFVIPRHTIDVPTDPSGSTTLDLFTLLPGVLRSAILYMHVSLFGSVIVKFVP